MIEDHFVAGRPPWEEVGALFTDEVHRWELYKLPLLNAAHSCMAYLSALAGITYVDEAMDHAPPPRWMTRCGSSTSPRCSPKRCAPMRGSALRSAMRRAAFVTRARCAP